MKSKKSYNLSIPFICIFFLLNISDNVYSQFTCSSNNTCPGNLVGQVTFANKTGTTTGRWTLNDIIYNGLADQKFEVTDTAAYKFTNGNLTNTGGGTYAIVSNPSTVNGPLGTPLMNDNTDGVFLFRPNDNANYFARYIITGLNKKGDYCVKIKMRNAAAHLDCNQSLYAHIQFRSIAGIGLSGQGVTGGVWNRTSCNATKSGTWDGNNQSYGLMFDEDVAEYDINFHIGSDNANNLNDNGFSIYFKSDQQGANDVWGIDEIDVYGCITQQISSSNGAQICQGTPTVLTAMGIGSTTDAYEWRIGNSTGTVLASTSNTLSDAPAAATTYWVKCIRTGFTLTTTITPVNCCGPTGLFTVPKVCETITVDGIIDTIATEKVWNVAPWVNVDGTKSAPIGAGNHDCPGNGVQEAPAGKWKTVYDNSNIYFFFVVFDDNPSNTYPDNQYYWMDGVEIYLKDAAGNAKQFGAGYSATSSLGYGNLAGTTHKIVKSATYWCLEVSIPLAANNIDVTKGFISLEAAINQSKDGTACRAAQICTWTASAGFYSSTSQYHVAPLSNCASIVASEDTLCSGGSTTLSTQLTTVYNKPTYTWQSSATGATGSFTDITPSPGSTNSVTISPPGTIFYRAINDGVATCPVKIIFPNLNIGASSNATSFCPGSTMTLTGTTTETGVQWGWKKGTTFNTSTFISGYTLSNDVTKKVYSKTFASGDEGNYYFVVFKNGCGPNFPLIISLTSSPTITATGANRCGAGTVNLTATASSGTINWYTAASGGTSIGTGSPWTTPSISKDSTFYAEAADGSCVSATRASAVAKINTTPTITAVGNSRNGSGTLDLTATASSGTINWYTAASGGTSIGTGSPWTTPNISSTTTYYAEAVDGLCVSATRASAIAVIGTFPTITAKGDSICGTGTITLTAVASSGIINWYTTATGGTSIGTGSPWTTPSISTTTTYYAEAVDGTQISITRASAVATIKTIPNITATGSTVCSGSSANLSASNGTNYSWNTGSTTNPLIVSPSINTTYTVTGTNDGCSNTAQAVVIVEKNPTVNVGQDVNECFSNPSPNVTLTESGGDAIKWKWSTSATTQTINVSPSSTTNYIVTGTDGNNCSNTDEIQIIVAPIPKAAIFIENDKVNINTQIQFTDKSQNASSWIWNFGDGTNISTDQNPLHTFTKKNEHDSVTLIVSSSQNCKDTSSLIISIINPSNIFLPSAFSPNGDGHNDFYFVLGEMKSMKLNIYNQWGILVFSTNSQTSGWDGKYKGVEQPEGNYSYIFEAIDNEGNTVHLNGLIALLR